MTSLHKSTPNIKKLKAGFGKITLIINKQILKREEEKKECNLSMRHVLLSVDAAMWAIMHGVKEQDF